MKLLKKNYKIFFFPALFLLLFYIGLNLKSSPSSLFSEECVIHYINVGQGDASLIEGPNFNILIDAGPDASSDALIKYLKNHNIKAIDYVIATHPHEDHIGGMDEIIDAFKVKTFIAPKIKNNSTEFISLVKALNAKNLPITYVEENTLINLDEDDSLNFLYAGPKVAEDNLNNYSMVFSFKHKNKLFLFTGDIEKAVEEKLSISGVLSKTDVLKVAHHGSSTSSSQEFIDVVKPSLSIISCGMGNDYGHPNNSTLTSLNKINSKILRTDINGNIIIKVNENGLLFSIEKADK